ncbi:PTS glucose transporter subunit IIA [Paenibacillus antri]|uniref:PTS glucose transporter subunit IIA n=1 Tax=Paenibacillus antri TaxID=2582848 RepID=A0A5R9GB54_9BACL|nr:glucose PTS transporter subunit IIA [Paenibacillus antri]TLS49953.1 PTS glucose transporter subunit IIA [Paenibacillus antri]
MNWMGILQQFGRSLMMPMIALPAAAILLRLGAIPWEAVGFDQLSDLFRYAGMTVFTYLPYIFAVGVALGLSESAGIAGMSALVGYFVYDRVTQFFIPAGFELGVTSGIVIGIMAALLYHRFKEIRFPEYIQFFGGPRFVLLIMCFASFLFSVLVVQIGPYVQTGLRELSGLLLGMGGFGAFLYGMMHRLLVPSGLHYILNNVVWFQTGTYERLDGSIVNGDLPRFFAGDPTAGIFMAGLYPTMMFALPAIAFAIIHEAREDLKPKVKATFLTAALSSFLTGVTEPIEFAFLFVAPYLFVIHAILSGLSMWITYALDIHHGFAFSAGAIDFLLNNHLATNSWMLLPIGLAYGVCYYLLFRWAIRRFQIPTPGREEGSALDDWAGDIPYRAPLILQALGGKENVVRIEACITRLRLTLANDREMDVGALRHLGAAGVITLGGGNVQVVFGTFSELIREEIMKTIRKDPRVVPFRSPVAGRMIPLEDVPDPVFAGKIVGDGAAFLPERGELVAPVAGKISTLFPTAHAIGIVTAEGLEVLLHIGIDSSQVPNEPFEAHVTEGETVQPGQLLITFDLTKLRKHAKSIATPMVVTNPARVKSWSYAPFKAVRKGQASVMSVTLKEDPSDVNRA